jgi:hypothetical protein
MTNLFHVIYHYFDKLEDRVRGRLSRFPILYTLIAGTAIVLFWRGVWETADEFAAFIPPSLSWIDGPLSTLISIFILLITGLFVSFFVSDQIIVSGLKQEKKLVEKTEIEVQEESGKLDDMRRKINVVEKEVEEIHDKLAK